MFYSTAVSQTFIKGDLYPYIYRENAQPSAKCTFKPLNLPKIGKLP